MSNETNKKHLLKTLDCLSETAKQSLDGLNSDVRILREQILALPNEIDTDDVAD